MSPEEQEYFLDGNANIICRGLSRVEGCLVTDVCSYDTFSKFISVCFVLSYLINTMIRNCGSRKGRTKGGSFGLAFPQVSNY